MFDQLVRNELSKINKFPVNSIAIDSQRFEKMKFQVLFARSDLLMFLAIKNKRILHEIFTVA